MSSLKHFWIFIITPAIPHSAFKMKVTFCVTAVFTPILAKHSKSFSLIDCVSVHVDRMQRSFDPMRKQMEDCQQSELTDVTAKIVIYEAFVEGQLEDPKHVARTVHDLYFEPKYEEFRPRTIWSLSNAFTSAFKEQGPSSLCPSFFPLNLRNESVALHSERLLAENLPCHGPRMKAAIISS
jgi:hypothetical protein